MAQEKKFGPVDASLVPRFADVATFLRTPRLPLDEDIDIGLVGVPFDLGLNYRSGPRQGPAGVREASRIIRGVHPTSGIKPYELCNVADIGDAPINPLNKDESIASIQAFFSALRQRDIRPLSIGGDHTIPLPIIRALAASGDPIAVLQIDAHPDTFDELCGSKVNHATFMRRVLEEDLIDPARVVQIGLRGSRFSEDDIQFGRDAGFTVITFDDYDEMGRRAAIELINKTLGNCPLYITLDIDGIDPAFAPGTPVPEIGGLTPRDLQVIIRAIENRRILGCDISEVAPCYDPTGITCITAANLMFELLCLMTQSNTTK